MIPVRKSFLTLAVASLAAGSLPAMAEEYEVQMRGLGSDGKFMVFEPAFLKIEPGDTVTFVPAQGRHNSEPIPGMLPEGAELWKGAIHEEITVTFNVEGVYGYMCEPHYRLMGMVGLIQVGDDLSNLKEAQAVEHPHMAGRRMAELFKQVRSDGGGHGTVDQEAQTVPQDKWSLQTTRLATPSSRCCLVDRATSASFRCRDGADGRRSYADETDTDCS